MYSNNCLSLFRRRSIVLVMWAQAPLHSSKGTPVCGVVTLRSPVGWNKFTIFGQYLTIAWKRYEIGPWLLLNVMLIGSRRILFYGMYFIVVHHRWALLSGTLQMLTDWLTAWLASALCGFTMIYIYIYIYIYIEMIRFYHLWLQSAKFDIFLLTKWIMAGTN